MLCNSWLPLVIGNSPTRLPFGCCCIERTCGRKLFASGTVQCPRRTSFLPIAVRLCTEIGLKFWGKDATASGAVVFGRGVVSVFAFKYYKAQSRLGTSVAPKTHENVDGSHIPHLCGFRKTPLPPLRRCTSVIPNRIKTWTGAHTAHLCGCRRTPLPPLKGGTSVARNLIKTKTGAT